MKKMFLLVAVAFLAIGVFGCMKKESNGEETYSLKLGHNFTEVHPVHIALLEGIEQIKKESDGRIDIQVFPNANLGKDTEMIEQIRNGLLDFMKVSASFLEGFDETYAVFSLPYLFKDQEHFYKFFQSDSAKEIYQTSLDKGFMPLTFFDAGARNFYTKDKFINSPDDLKGMKIRVMNSNVATQMIDLLGGTATPIPFNDVYVSIQQGVVDGAENNMLALTEQKHGEVAKFYSFDGHTRIPDLLIVGAKTWNKLNEEDQGIIRRGFELATKRQLELWNISQAQAREEAEKIGVQFSENVDKDAFVEKVQPLIESFKQDPAKAKIIDLITSMR